MPWPTCSWTDRQTHVNKRKHEKQKEGLLAAPARGGRQQRVGACCVPCTSPQFARGLVSRDYTVPKRPVCQPSGGSRNRANRGPVLAGLLRVWAPPCTSSACHLSDCHRLSCLASPQSLRTVVSLGQLNLPKPVPKGSALKCVKEHLHLSPPSLTSDLWLSTHIRLTLPITLNFLPFQDALPLRHPATSA